MSLFIFVLVTGAIMLIVLTGFEAQVFLPKDFRNAQYVDSGIPFGATLSISSYLIVGALAARFLSQFEATFIVAILLVTCLWQLGGRFFDRNSAETSTAKNRLTEAFIAMPLFHLCIQEIVTNEHDQAMLIVLSALFSTAIAIILELRNWKRHQRIWIIALAPLVASFVAVLATKDDHSIVPALGSMAMIPCVISVLHGKFRIAYGAPPEVPAGTSGE